MIEDLAGDVRWILDTQVPVDVERATELFDELVARHGKIAMAAALRRATSDDELSEVAGPFA